jgi:malonyl CoA-acyl carrier protein transacylase
LITGLNDEIECMMLVQVGLVEILKAVGIEADGIIGLSVGEMGCSYMDGSFTAEQMILAAYYCGRASLETNLIQGLMAAVGRPVLCNFLHAAHSGLSMLTVP